MTTKSFLRWAGSKQQLIPELKKYWNSSNKRYLEPFMGSSKLFFSLDLEAESAVLSDINVDLVETYRQVKNHPYEVFQIFRALTVSSIDYYKIRNIDPKSLGVNQRAARFIYLNKLCFNGLYRTNLNGVFNVPYSGLTKLDYISEYKILKEASKKLKNSTILCGDFETIVKTNVDRGDFVYLDPPYAVENRRIFKQYGPQTFGLDDLKRMKNTLKYIDNIGAKFLVSYAYCSEALDTFKNWPMEKKFTQRNISGFSQYRRKAAELLISNIS